MSFMMLQVISPEVKVNSMLKDKTRNWRPARSKTLVTIHSQLFLVELKNEDKALRQATKFQKFSRAVIYIEIRDKSSEVKW